jgi:hypothetical protein
MKLSLVKYGWKCALGTEVIYIFCLTYGRFLSGRAYEFHQAFFETLPFFAWSSLPGIVGAGIYLFALSWLFALYYVWMFNTSLKTKEKGGCCHGTR